MGLFCSMWVEWDIVCTAVRVHRVSMDIFMHVSFKAQGAVWNRRWLLWRLLYSFLVWVLCLMPRISWASTPRLQCCPRYVFSLSFRSLLKNIHILSIVYICTVLKYICLSEFHPEIIDIIAFEVELENFHIWIKLRTSKLPPIRTVLFDS